MHCYIIIVVSSSVAVYNIMYTMSLSLPLITVYPINIVHEYTVDVAILKTGIIPAKILLFQ